MGSPPCDDLDISNKEYEGFSEYIMHNYYMILIFAYWVILYIFFCHLLFFSESTFSKILSGIPSECQTVWIQIRHGILSGLIWVQNICTGNQQTILVGKRVLPIPDNPTALFTVSEFTVSRPNSALTLNPL